MLNQNLKILGGIKAGVTEFIYPKENNKDFKQFMEKFEEKEEVKNIIFPEYLSLIESNSFDSLAKQ